MRKLISSILFLLATAGVTAAAHAVQLKIFLNGSTTPFFTSNDVAVTGTCAVAPCTFTARSTITDGSYSSVVSTVGAYAEAKVQTNSRGTDGTFGSALAASTSITTIINVTGQFKYIGSAPGTIDLETSHTFPLRTGVWNTAGRSGSKCAKQSTGKYSGSSCTNSSTTVENGSCTFCRAYGFTDEGYVTRLGSDGSQLPAGGVTITMKSQVGFFNASSPATLIRTELIGGANPTNPPSTTNGGALTWFIDPNSNLVEDGHFYLGSNLTETVPCEPLTGSTTLNCHASERKTSRLTFANLQFNDLVSLPVTSTDVGAADLAILAINLQANMPIDVQPIDPVLNSDSATMISNPIIGGANNDFNVNSTGKRQVLALNTYKSDGTVNVDACAFPREKVSLTVAGSNPPAPAESGAPYLAQNGTCLGQVFTFDYSNILIPGDDKQATCLANPTATLLVSDVPLSSEYEVVAGKKGSPKKASYTPPDPTCTSSGGVVTCTINAEVGGSQVVRCCTSCGG